MVTAIFGANPKIVVGDTWWIWDLLRCVVIIIIIIMIIIIIIIIVVVVLLSATMSL